VPVVARVDWHGMQGVDLLGPDVTVPTGVPVVERAVYELLRIEAGIPAMGAELDDHTIPAEAGVVERSVSFTKGCYTGQELVARVDSRGSNTPRRLRGVVVAGAVPPQGAELVLDDRVVGVLTSVEPSPEGALALAYVRREVEPPAELRVRTPAGDLPVHVAALPLVVD
jgi:folate-binding protein YgfZ